MVIGMYEGHLLCYVGHVTIYPGIGHCVVLLTDHGVVIASHLFWCSSGQGACNSVPLRGGI